MSDFCQVIVCCCMSLENAEWSTVATSVDLHVKHIPCRCSLGNSTASQGLQQKERFRSLVRCTKQQHMIWTFCRSWRWLKQLWFHGLKMCQGPCHKAGLQQVAFLCPCITARVKAFPYTIATLALSTNQFHIGHSLGRMCNSAP